MVFMTREVEITTLGNDIIQGVVVTYEHIRYIKNSIPIFSLVDPWQLKYGFFIFKDEKLSFVHRDEVKSMISLKYV
jgi:hypothetical protein